MCFSAEVSYAAAAILLPAGVVSTSRAYRKDRQYLAIAALPLFFGLQQLFEGLEWTAFDRGDPSWIQTFSLAYMFFSWLAWPVWVPFSVYFLEPCGRRHLYLVFSILGGMLGAVQFIPYFAHEGWLTVKFLDHAISYEGTVLFDFIMRREMTYAVYLFVILVPLSHILQEKRQYFRNALGSGDSRHLRIFQVRIHFRLLLWWRNHVGLSRLHGVS